MGTLLRSFPQADVAMRKLLELSFGRKRIERITERIGAERLQQAEQVADFQKLTLMEKIEGPVGVAAPEAAAVMLDGGRYQRQEQNPDATSEKSTHWFEYKAGLCLELEDRRDGVERGPEACDPCPEVPDFLLNLDYVDKLTREIGQKAALMADESIDCGGVPTASDPPGRADSDEAPVDIDLEAVKSLADLEAQLAAVNAEASSRRDAEQVPLSPRVQSREVVATLEKGPQIGLQLAARAWKLGMFQAAYKAFVGDGSGWIWTIYATFFKPFGFIQILDIIHGVTYVYAAAMAGRTHWEGAAVYRQWVRWLWQGEVSQVIAALAARQAELGLPSSEESDTSPRRIVSQALTYLQNQQGRMRYPEYRKLGLPITSSHMESAIKELNYRIKGTEKFWGEDGGASILQMKSDTLSDSDPLAEFWTTRCATRTGFHNSVGRRKPAKQAAA